MKKRLLSIVMILMMFASVFTGCASLVNEISNVASDVLADTDDFDTNVKVNIGNIEVSVPADIDDVETDVTVDTGDIETDVTVDVGDIENDIPDDVASGIEVTEDGEYTDVSSVALYIHSFDKLPSNYITKNEAKELGWVSKEGNMWEVAPGKSIGGDRFGNNEGLLPKKKGREYHECDIDFDGTYRNEKRIVFSNDGLIYYTDDHYQSFKLLYGEE